MKQMCMACGIVVLGLIQIEPFHLMEVRLPAWRVKIIVVFDRVANLIGGDLCVVAMPYSGGRKRVAQQ